MRLSITGLVRLARAVQAKLDEKVDRAGSAPILATRSESDRDATAAAPGTMFLGIETVAATMER